jgi:WhiB family redox-sensing transcriptional regulator
MATDSREGQLMAEVSRLPLPIADNWDWQSNGACRSFPPEMFFHPEGERGPSRRARISEAKSICGTCPVLLQCRTHALSVQEPYGIWGGLSEDEREVILTREGRRGDVA